MCRSEKGDSNVLRKCNRKKIVGNIGAEAGREETLCGEVENVS